ncbi:MAG: hypothetical protein ACYC1Y_03765 [Minisyncoccota bacterium]
MDELLIEDKKYVSSKRAAKITGYAKDYIGQLCREGRVPARLVGRSWYVLEAAIQDHRFGAAAEREAKNVVRATIPTFSSSPLLQTWQPPHYEAAPSAEFLPSLNRLEGTESTPIPVQKKEIPPETAAPDLDESWKTWFDHVAEAPETPEAHSFPMMSTMIMPENDEAPEEEPEAETEEDDPVVSVPLHILSQAPQQRQQESFSRENTPPRDTSKHQEAVARQTRARGNKATRLLQVTLVLVGVSALAIASIGSGYFDTYLISTNQAAAISGITVYNK